MTAFFSQAEYQERRAKAAAELERRRLDAAVVVLPEHLNYLSGFDPTDLHDEYYGVLSNDGAIRLLVPTDAARLAEETLEPSVELETYSFSENKAERAAGLISSAVPRDARIGYEGNWYILSRARLQELSNCLPTAEWVEATDLLVEQRIVKSSAEIEVFRKAATLSDIAMGAGVRVMQEGVREFEVEASIQQKFAHHGSEYASFPPLVCSGWRSGLFHGFPTDRRLERADAVFIELAGTVARYNSNMCRTIFVSEVTPLHRELWDIVSEAFWRGAELVRPGEPVGNVDRMTKEIRGKYSDYFPARAGFGLELSYPPVWIGGLSILEGDPHVFQPGMIFSLEPSVAGYRDTTVILGSNILVTELGHEVLNKFTHEIIVC